MNAKSVSVADGLGHLNGSARKTGPIIMIYGYISFSSTGRDGAIITITGEKSAQLAYFILIHDGTLGIGTARINIGSDQILFNTAATAPTSSFGTGNAVIVGSYISSS